MLLAHHLGRALQLTNILRDIDEDAGIGRLYLPREALLHAGITGDDPRHGDRRPGAAESLRAAGAARGDAFRQGRRDHGPQPAPRGARAAHHVEILSRHSRPADRARLCRAARAGACEQSVTSSSSSSATLSSDAKNRSHHRRRNFRPFRGRAARQCRLQGPSCTRRRSRPAAAAAPISTRATNLTIDNGNHLLLSGNRHALRLCARDRHRGGLVGPERAQFPFVDIDDRATLAARSRRRPAADLGVRREPPRARHRPADYLKLAPLIWAARAARWSATPFPAKARCISAWCSRCCSLRSISIRRKARPGLPARSCARRCWRAGRPAVR